METLLHDWGWAGVVVYIFFREVWPWIRARFDKSADQEALLEAQRAEAELKAREARDARDAAREERMVRAMEDMAKSSSGIERILGVVNVRLDVIERHLGLDKQPEPVAVDAGQERRTQPRKRGAP